MNVESELQQLVGEIKRLGVTGPDGSTTVSFGKLVNDERVSQICAPPFPLSSLRCDCLLRQGQITSNPVTDRMSSIAR